MQFGALRENVRDSNVRRTDKTRSFLTGSLIVACVLCIGVFSFLTYYMNKQNEDAVHHVGSLYMAGINERISKHFETMVDFRLSQLSALVDTAPLEQDAESGELQEWLEFNANARGFVGLAYYFDDGTSEVIYGDEVSSVNPERLQESLQAGESRISIGITEDGGQKALIGTPFHVEMQDGRTCISLVGQLPVEYLSETLSLDDEEALVYSFVVRNDGSFVVRSADAFRDNYFDRMRALYEVQDRKSAEDHIEELRAAMEADQTYSMVFRVEGEHRQMYCSALPMSEWNLITVMPYGTLNETMESLQNRSLLVAIGGCSVVILVLLFIFLKYSKINRRQVCELEEARLEAEAASRSKSEFLSNMSHDIRTPMNAIVGMTAIAMTNIENPGRLQDCLRKITLSSKHLLGLINDMLDMSKIESGKMTLNVELVSLREMMSSIVNIIQPQIREKQQKFNVFIYDISAENVLCDSVRLNQILLNLLSNAIKFTPERGSIEMSLHEKKSPKGEDYVRIIIGVKDNGIGMSEEFKERIFESFTREDSRRVHRTEGSGLGMAITKYIVDAMGGDIQVESRQGVGTSFVVTLDFKRTTEQEEDMVLPAFTMLVVDDDQQLCESTAASLNSIGIEAEWTLDGESAVEMVRRRHEKHDDYYVILLDWKLPGMDGIRTAKELRKQLGNDVPILLISAYDCSEIEAEAREAGISGFLSKPLFKSTLYYGLKPYVDSQDEKAAGQEGPAEDFAGVRVLLAEDNELNWEIASTLLEETGMILDWAENGKVCTELFEKSPAGYYDAILMDIRMPVMDGYEAAEAIRAMDRTDHSVPIIAMTADAFSEDIKRCLDHGMNAHVAKPIDVKAVCRVLGKYINERNE